MSYCRKSQKEKLELAKRFFQAKIFLKVKGTLFDQMIFFRKVESVEETVGLFPQLFSPTLISSTGPKNDQRSQLRLGKRFSLTENLKKTWKNRLPFFRS